MVAFSSKASGSVLSGSGCGGPPFDFDDRGFGNWGDDEDDDKEEIPAPTSLVAALVVLRLVTLVSVGYLFGKGLVFLLKLKGKL